MLPPLLTVAEVSQRLRIPRERVYGLISDGSLKAYRLSPRRLRVDADHLDAWVASRGTSSADA